MTTLRFRRAVPVAVPDPLRPAWCEPDEAAAVGVIELRPHARQHETTGGHRVALPALLTLALVAGEATVDVDAGHWQVRERIRAGAAQPWTVLVPDAVGIPAWSATADYEIDDKVTRGGVTYRCLVAHGAAYGGTWGPPLASVWAIVP